MSAFNNVIQWYESAEMDKPELRSPTPCPRGVYCQYKLPNKETKELELACCRMVHPGEEGNGRRLFPARTAPDGRQQQACVRLTGNALFYERCRLKLPWRRFAAQRGIPLPPADVPWVQVERGPILPNPQAEINERHRAMKRYHYQCVAERRAAAGGGTGEYEGCPFSEEQLANLRAGADYNDELKAQEEKEYQRHQDPAAPISAADWPALPYKVPQLQPRSAVPNSSAIPAPINFSAEAPVPARPCFPPPRLNLSGGGCPSYGFTAAESFHEPPRIQRLRSDRLYDEDEETGCATPTLLGSVNDEEDGCASPRLLPFRSRVQRIDEKLHTLISKGASLEEALQAATGAVNKEIIAEAAEGGMEAVD